MQKLYIVKFLNIIYILDILVTLQKTEFVIHLHILHFTLNIIHILNNKLQTKTETLSQAANTVEGVIQTFEGSRNS